MMTLMFQAVDPVNVFKHPTAKPQQLTRTQPTTWSYSRSICLDPKQNLKNIVVNTIKTTKPNPAQTRPLQTQVKPTPIPTTRI